MLTPLQLDAASGSMTSNEQQFFLRRWARIAQLRKQAA